MSRPLFRTTTSLSAVDSGLGLSLSFFELDRANFLKLPLFFVKLDGGLEGVDPEDRVSVIGVRCSAEGASSGGVCSVGSWGCVAIRLRGTEDFDST